MANDQENERNKAVVRRFVDEVFVAGRKESVDGLVAPDFVPHSWPGTGPGPAELKGAMARVFAGLSDVPTRSRRSTFSASVTD